MPSQPGVYWFLDGANQVLYVGKAKNLKNRVNTYRQVNQLSSRIRGMVETAQQLKWQVLDSELEALLVEAELIRTHQPPTNILLKDDKTPLYIQITAEPYPRVLTRRKKETETRPMKGTLLGPFPSAYKVREVLGIARKIFPWCNEGVDPAKPNSRPCFFYHISQCPGACIGRVTPEEYQQTIAQLVMFLKGQKKDVVRMISQQMKLASEQEQYELAATLRDRVEVITAVTQRTYSLRPDLTLPHLRASQAEEGVVYLRKMLSTYLSLPATFPLHRIEAYDVSNISGTYAAVSMVTFIDGQAVNQEYKVFNIRTLDTPNDFAMLQEALQRRQNHPEWGQPDLIVIDGGKGQLRAALKVWQWTTPVISIAKDPDRLIIPGPELISQPSPKRSLKDYQLGSVPRYHVLRLPETHPGLKLIQQLRDEAHRFSKRQQSRRRLNQMFT